MKRNYIRLVAIAVVVVCAGCCANIFSSSSGKEKDKNVEEWFSFAQDAEKKLKDYADQIVLKNSPLSSIVRWGNDWDTIKSYIDAAIAQMPKKGSKSLNKTKRSNIENAIKKMKEYRGISFVDFEKVNVKDIKKLRGDLAVKKGYTWSGGDTPATRKIKIFLRNALLQFLRIVEHEQARGAKRPKVAEKPEYWEMEKFVEGEFD